MIRHLALLCLLLSCATAIAPQVHEHKSMGLYWLPQLLYRLSVDCDEGLVNVTVMDANFTRIENASTFLKYVDFASPHISTERTDEEGNVVKSFGSGMITCPFCERQ